MNGEDKTVELNIKEKLFIYGTMTVGLIGAIGILFWGAVELLKYL